jgi:T5SS/PEP-CTERM-associated repeat protein
MLVSNRGVVVNNNGWIGLGSAASNNSVLVTGAGSLWSNGGALTIGAGGSAGNSLTVTNGGLVQASQIIVHAGNLRVGVTNGLGASTVTLGGGSGAPATLAISTNLTISSLIWSSNSIMSFTPGSQTLAISGALTNAGGGVFDFGGYTNTGTNTLITFGTNAGGSFTTNSFSVLGSTD